MLGSWYFRDVLEGEVYLIEVIVGIVGVRGRSCLFVGGDVYFEF